MLPLKRVRDNEYSKSNERINTRSMLFFAIFLKKKENDFSKQQQSHQGSC